MISIIVAISANNAIGKDNNLLWHISEDLKYFKRVTSGHTVIMGNKTFLSLGGKPLPKRRNIILSRSSQDVASMGVEYFNNLEDAAKDASKTDEEVFIIGGGQIYSQGLKIADKLYITEVDTTIPDADTFFPEIDTQIWKEASRDEKMYDEKSQLSYTFVSYIRK